MDHDGLLELSRAILATPSLANVRVTRGARQVYWMSREAPRDTLALTHPRTSTDSANVRAHPSTRPSRVWRGDRFWDWVMRTRAGRRLPVSRYRSFSRSVIECRL